MKTSERLLIPAQTMPCRPSEKRKKTMDEVPIGYTEEMAVAESLRCLQCKNSPCIKGCPVSIDIPKMLKLTAEKKFTEALSVIKENSFLPAICGRVCPQESQCQKECTLGKMKNGTIIPVFIGNVERFLADNYSDKVVSVKNKPATGKKIAVVGSGPGGLTCAGELALMGHKVVLFEALHELGGVLVYGIPEFRLPRSILKKEVDFLKKMGVEFKTNTIIGKTITVDELLNEFDAVYIGTGAGVPGFPGIEGEDLPGAYSANEYLTRVNLMGAWKSDARTPISVGKVTIAIGGGNVAIDAARTSLRLGSERVIVAYRRLKEDMPARIEEIHHAEEEGIEFRFLLSPEKIIEGEDGRISKILFREMRIEKDPGGGRNKIFDTERTTTLDCDVVIFATGSSPNTIASSDCPDLKLTSWGGIVVNPQTMQTSVPKIFAGGDAVSGAATVILAMSNGKTAAKHIDEFIMK